MSDEIREKEMLIERKARFFYNSGEKVHVTLKKIDFNGKKQWERGWIKEDPSADHFILKYTPEGALKHGREEDPYFNLEVEDIEAYEDGGGQ